MRKILTWVSLLVLIGPGILLPEIVGAIQDGYSSRSNYLSELGAIGAPHANLINYGGFLPIALAVVILVIALYQKLALFPLARTGALFLLGIAIGYFGAFFFHCDAGCPIEGSGRQALHNLGGIIEYAGAIIGLTLICLGLRTKAPFAISGATLGAALIVTFSFVMMVSPDMQEWKGGWQRLAEYTLVLWFVIVTLWSPKR